MPEQDQQPLSHCNKYAADSACVHCEGIIRHESWCATQNIFRSLRVSSDPGP